MEDPNAAINFVRAQQGREPVNPFIIEDEPEMGTMQPRGGFAPPDPPPSPLIPPMRPVPPPPRPIQPSAPTSQPIVLMTEAEHERLEDEVATYKAKQDTEKSSGLWITGSSARYKGREVLLTDPEHRRIIEIVLRAEARIVQEHLSEIGVTRTRRSRSNEPTGASEPPKRRGGRPKGSKNKPKPPKEGTS